MQSRLNSGAILICQLIFLVVIQQVDRTNGNKLKKNQIHFLYPIIDAHEGDLQKPRLITRNSKFGDGIQMLTQK